MLHDRQAAAPLPQPTWQVQQQQLQHAHVQALQLPPEHEDACPDGAHQRIEQVEHLLRGPAVLGHAQVDAQQLDLRGDDARWA